MRKKSKEYKIFKNFLHNDVKITKDDIYYMVQKSIDHLVEKRIDDLMYTGKFQDIIMHKVSNMVNKGKIRDNFFNQISFSDWVKDEVRQQVKYKVIDNINFDINVDVKNKK